MTIEQVANWIKGRLPQYQGRIRLGAVDGNADRFLGVFPGTPSGGQRIALGGLYCTRYDTLPVRLRLRCGKSQIVAEQQARELWREFYGVAGVIMGGTSVACVDPGAGPIPIGRGADGVFEYIIDLTITYMKE